MKREDAAFLFWMLFKTASVMFILMFVMGLVVGFFCLIGINRPFLQYQNAIFLMLGGAGGTLIMFYRADIEMKRLLKVSGV